MSGGTRADVRRASRIGCGSTEEPRSLTCPDAAGIRDGEGHGMKVSFTALRFMVASIVPALADQTVDVEGAKIILVAPAGQCFLDKTDAVQKQVDERIAADVRSVHYLATSVPCNWKPTSFDEDSGTYAVWSAVPDDNGSAVVPSQVSRRSLLDEVTQDAMPAAADLNKALERFKAERRWLRSPDSPYLWGATKMLSTWG